MIGGEYLGPASEAYRGRAQEIVGQARLLLTAIEDLDFAARQSPSGADAEASVDLGPLIEQLVTSLREHADKRGAVDRRLALHRRPDRQDRAGPGRAADRADVPRDHRPGAAGRAPAASPPTRRKTIAR